MVYKVMPTIPASDLRKYQAEIIARVKETPLLLTHNGHAAGILVHPKVWNDILEIYERWLKFNPPTLDVDDAVTWEEFMRLQEPEVALHNVG